MCKSKKQNKQKTKKAKKPNKAFFMVIYGWKRIIKNNMYWVF